MNPGQTLKTDEGIEVILFPLQEMWITQGENGSYSHQGTLNMDFQGMLNGSRKLLCPYYAPVSITLKEKGPPSESTKYWCSWLSDEPCLFADGHINYVTFLTMHDESMPPIGTHCNQGDLMGHTGNAGPSSGDHLHLNVGNGKNLNWHYPPPEGHGELASSIHIYDACFVNDTVLLKPLSYPWRKYEGNTLKSGFPWQIYAERLRKRRSYVK